MSSHNDSFAASGNSPTQSEPDFSIRDEGSIVLLSPLPLGVEIPEDARWPLDGDAI